MNEKDIYQLIENSFDDKIKLDFNDVKNRIQNLDNTNIITVAPSAPSKRKSGKIFTIVGTAAACLVCVFGLSIFLLQFAGTKEEASFVSYDVAPSYNEDAVFYSYEDATAYGDYFTDDAKFNCTEACVEETAPEAPEEMLSEENLSDSDLSETDILSGSDTE